MRRAYIAADEPFDRAVARALQWAGDTATIHAPDTASVEEDDLEDFGVPITSPSSKSRFHGYPRGTVICAFLDISQILDVERHGRSRGALPPSVDG
jgi:hypothetical protein